MGTLSTTRLAILGRVTPLMNMLPRGQILLETVKAPITRALVANDVELTTAGGLAVSSTAGVPAISMLVVAYRETDSLLQLLGTLARTAIRAASTGVEATPRFEIILVDNGLRADVVALALPLLHHYVKCKANVGCSQGRNVGAGFCSAPLVAFVDADAQIDEGYVAACVRAMDNPTLMAVRGRVVPRGPGGQLPTHYDLGPVAGPAPIAAEGASVWRTAAFCQAGGFEASLYGREGPVLCYRMHLLMDTPMSAFGYAPTILLRHDYFASPQHLQAKLERNARIIDQVDRAYPMLRLFLAQFPTFGNKKRAAVRVQLRSQAARAKIRWNNSANDGAELPIEPVCVVIEPSRRSSDRAMACLAQQTKRCAQIVNTESSALVPTTATSTPTIATGVACTWQLSVRADDWLHPTLIERIGNVLRQYPEAATVVVPRGREQGQVNARRINVAGQDAPRTAPARGAAELVLAPPPVLVTRAVPVEAAVFQVASAVLTKLGPRR